ncbi:PREDICTED: protein HIRA-like, partial [Rhagoletis zephyria]|uniref:protein HIRA-like n=1 Tax=Rhagoletis zephyria TaxID=28612 RepID=UPI0008119BA8
MCFNPNIFRFQSVAAVASKASKGSDKGDKENKEAKLKRQSVIAVNSHDQSISIWATARGGRPLMVCKDLFENSILDFSWSPDGYKLMACSSDGTVTFIEFTEKELHSKVISSSKSAITSNLIEDGDMALLRKKQQSAVKELLSTGFMPVAAEDLPSTSKKPSSVEMFGNNNSNSSKGAIGGGLRLAKGPLKEQIENHSADSRRRIIPLFIPLVSDALVNEEMDHCGGGGGGSVVASGSTSAAAGSFNSMSFSSSSEAKSKIVMETRGESNSPMEYMTYVSSDQVMSNGLTNAKTTTAASAGKGTSKGAKGGGSKSQVRPESSDDSSSSSDIILPRKGRRKRKVVNFLSQSTDEEEGGSEPQKTPSMNVTCAPGKQGNNMSHSSNNTSNSSEYRPKSPVPSTSSAATTTFTNGTMVKAANKVANSSNSTSHVRPESSSDSSSSDIILPRKGRRKRNFANFMLQSTDEEEGGSEPQKTPSMNVTCAPGKQGNNMSHSSNNTSNS